MSARLALVLALVACDDGVRLLPEAPAEARSIAVLSDGIGTWTRLPRAAPIHVPPGAVEAHYFASDLPAGAPDEVAVEATLLACPVRALPEPIAAFTLEKEGPRMATPRTLVAPTLDCASTDESSIAPLDTGRSCRLAQTRAVTCGLEVDLRLCGQGELSTWPARLDGTLCGPPEGDVLCKRVSATPPGAIFGAECAGEPYAVYAAEPFALEVETIEIDPFLRARRLPGGRDIIDLLVTPSRIIVSLSFAAHGECNSHAAPSVLLFYDRALGTFTSTGSGPPCLRGFVPADDGGFFATFQPPTWPLRIGVGRFDRHGVTLGTSVWAITDYFTAQDVKLEHVIDLFDTGPRLLTSFATLAPPEREAPTHMVMIEWDKETLLPGSWGGDHAVVRGVAIDRAAGAIVVADDREDWLRFFPYPLAFPTFEQEPKLADRTQLLPGMGPLIAAGDRQVWISGRTRTRPGLAIYDGRTGDGPTSRATFVRDPMASAMALHRIGPTRALGLFHNVDFIGDPNAPPLPLWATVFDFADPLAVVMGTKAEIIGAEPVFQTRLDPDGVTVWAILPRDRKIVGLRER